MLQDIKQSFILLAAVMAAVQVLPEQRHEPCCILSPQFYLGILVNHCEDIIAGAAFFLLVILQGTD
jgi:hypothetical protein